MAKVKMSEDEMIEKLCESFNLSDKGEAELRAFTYEIKVRVITLAVSKERERVASKTDEVWDLLCQMDTNIKSEKEYAKDIINLINNK